MEQLNLSAAKEEAIRSNWNEVLPASSRENEDELPNIPSDNHQGEPGPSRIVNTWDDVVGEPQVSIEDDYTTAESQRLDEDDEDSLYEEEGRIMESYEYGHLTERVRTVINRDGTDVRSLGDRKVEVDISFLTSIASQSRVKKIIEYIIKKYTSIPGNVETDRVNSLGVYTFNVTNPYLSPGTSSPDDHSMTRDPLSLKEDDIPIEDDEVINLLLSGIELTPKVAGLPKRVLKYGDHNLVKESLRKIIQQYPGKSPKEIIEIALRLSGNYKKVLNLYKLNC